MLSGSFEYDSERSLAIFQEYVEREHPVEATLIVFESEDDDQSLVGLGDTDVMLVFTRRLNTSGTELERFKAYCARGRPVVGVRTASHAFQSWLEFDKEVLGGNYNMHYGAGPVVRVAPASPEAKEHPILRGVSITKSHGSLYRNTPIAPDASLLLTGTTDEAQEPVAWTRINRGGRVFYTSLGHQEDFEDEAFLHMVANGVLWAGGRL
jgi:type 1 glutamine amidotransferase